MVERAKHGGARPGAGRKKSVKRGGPHRARPALQACNPAHVVLRTRVGVPRLRQARMYRAIRRVLGRYVGRGEFRIAQVSIQHNHLHLIVEASDARALTRGMQSFAINAARAINVAWGRRGAVFAGRYHATQIRTARQMRNALVYVLNNWRRHREDIADVRCLRAQLDPYSTAVSFAGWTKRFAVPAGYVPLPVSEPRTALLRTGWRWHGRLDPWDVPGPVGY
jgi:putative transposase